MSLKALKGIRQLRFLLCQHSATSEQLRNYISKNYEAIRTSPASITIRQLQYVTPSVIATYNFGIEKKTSLNNKSEADIDKIIADLEANSQTIASEIKI